MRATLRPLLAGLLVAAGALALLAGALLTDAARLLRPEVFADRVAASLADARVADYAAARLTDGLLARERDLTAYRPLLLAASRDVVRTDAFRGLVRAAARRAHAAAFSGVARGVVLSVPDLEVVFRGAMAATPALARAVPPNVQVAVATLGAQPAVRGAVRVLRLGALLARYAPWALGAGALLVALGVALMPDRRDALVGAGVALVVDAAALAAVAPLGRAAVAALAPSPETAGALRGLWTVALAGLPVWAMAYAGVGLALAAAGGTLLERLDAEELLGGARRLLVTPPARARWRLARAVALLAAGLAAVLAPRATLAALVVLGGLLTAFVGLRELFDAVRLAARRAGGGALRATALDALPPAARPVAGELWERREGLLVAGALVLVLATAVGVGALVVARPAARARVPTSIAACNGRAALCDRRLDEVTFAATHNSMSAADLPDWLFPQQERSIPAQLADGVRALLLDVHYGVPAEGTALGARVRTDFGRAPAAALGRARAALGEEGVAAATRARDRLVAGRAGASGVYLCHGFCELGARPLDAALGEVRDFLVAHPGEVLLLVVEDYVASRDLAAAFERAGLARLVYRGPGGAGGRRWPTLRELVARDERVVVFVESGRPGVPWLRPAFAELQETPYAFRDARDTLSCAPNRGGTGGGLLLVNHWIDTPPAPRPSNAAVVNAYPALMERALRCERERGRRVNVLAVDWYRTGGLLAVVDALNARDAGAAPGAAPETAPQAAPTLQAGPSPVPPSPTAP